MPSFERPEPIIVGSASQEKKQEYARLISDRFGAKQYEQLPEDKRAILESLEYEKKPYEKSAIRDANEVTDSMMSEFGLKPFDVPERNIHIIPKNLFREIEEDEDRTATAITNRQMTVYKKCRTSMC